MAALRMGVSGDAVERLQKRLGNLGFDPGAIDGAFGPATDAAVRAFQASEGLLVDGIVGRRTLEALNLGRKVAQPAPFAMESVTVPVVAEMFPGALIGNIKTHLPNVLDGVTHEDLADRLMVLMALATIRAETAGFEPINEGRSRYNTSPNGHPFDLYDNRADLGNRGAPDGARYKGRGFIQLTGRDNYRRIGRRLGEPLEREPDLANDSVIAARILAAFLKEKEIRIKQALVDGDLAHARRLVNGGSHGLDRFTACYETGARLLT
jgi:peptidoglycan L-alanyl-D-glutamate endopeptidase CwlK